MRPTFRQAALVTLLLAVPLAPAIANGGTVRISRARVGPWLVSVFSSPTPLRTGEVDISVLVQDTADAVVSDVPVTVEAHPVHVTTTDAPPITETATREEATNKLFRAAKFRVAATGEWEFRIRVGGDAGGDAGGEVSFRAALTEPTLLDRPYLLAALVLTPLLLVGWLLSRRRDAETAEARPSISRGSPR